MAHKSNTLEPILIIGGGIAGSVLALFLQKAGITCEVFEAYPRTKGVGSSFAVAPNGMKVLAALNLAERFKAKGELALSTLFLNARGHVLAQLKSPGAVGKFGQPTVSSLRANLFELLGDELETQAIPVHYEKKLVAVSEDESGVTAHFADGSTAHGSLIVGADGIHSRVRELLLPDGPKPQYVGIIGCGGVVPAEALPDMTTEQKQKITLTYGAKGFFGYCGLNGGQVTWWANTARTEPLTTEQLADVTAEGLKQEMLSTYAGYHEPVVALIRNTQHPVKTNIFDLQSLPTWHGGRIVLIGDAAHAVSPNTGQGASIAMEDSMLLAKLLRDHGMAHYETVFVDFELARKARAEKVVEKGRQLAVDKKPTGPMKQWGREFMIGTFVKLFGEKPFEWLYGYSINWDDNKEN